MKRTDYGIDATGFPRLGRLVRTGARVVQDPRTMADSDGSSGHRIRRARCDVYTKPSPGVGFRVAVRPAIYNSKIKRVTRIRADDGLKPYVRAARGLTRKHECIFSTHTHTHHKPSVRSRRRRTVSDFN